MYPVLPIGIARAQPTGYPMPRYLRYPPRHPSQGPSDTLPGTHPRDPHIQTSGTSYPDLRNLISRPQNLIYSTNTVPHSANTVPNSGKTVPKQQNSCQNSHILRCTLRYTRPFDWLWTRLVTSVNVYPHGMVPLRHVTNRQYRPSA